MSGKKRGFKHKLLLVCVLSSFALSGCMETANQTNPSVNASRDASATSVTQARQALRSGRGVTASLVVDQNPRGTRSATANNASPLMDMLGDYGATYATLPTTLTVRADNSPELAPIRAAGQTIYVFVATATQIHKRNVSSGTEGTEPMKNFTFEGGSAFCGGYHIALGPFNNYRFSYTRNKEYQIRVRATGMDMGWMGRVGSDNWEATRINGGAVVYRVSDQPFRQAHEGRTNQACMAPGMERYWG